MSVLYEAREAIARYRFRHGEPPEVHYVSQEDLLALEQELRRLPYKPGRIKSDGLLVSEIEIDGVPVKPMQVFSADAQ